MADVHLYQLPANGGEISVSGGVTELSQGLETAAYLSLFGGNEDDDGSQATRHLEWWGNKAETDEARKYRGRFAKMAESLPAVTGNIVRLRDAALDDLAWMKTEGIAEDIAVGARIPKLHRVAVDIEITVSGKKYPFTLEADWNP